MKWKSLTLGELTKNTRPICYGVLKPGPLVEDGVPLIRIVDVNENELNPSRLHRISLKLDGEFFRSRLRGGEVVISIQGTIGKVAVVPKGAAGANISRTLAVIDPDERCDTRYLYWYLRSLADTTGFRTVGSTRTSLNIAALRETEVPLPPLEEQKRIAAILDQADALRRLRARALDSLNALGQAVFHEMFGDPRSNPMGWPILPLGHIGELERGVSKHRPRNEPALLGGDHALIQTGDVSRAGDYILSFSSTYSDLGLKQSRKWPKGTLCITIAANIADTAILDFDACFPDSVVGFNSGDEATNFFVHRWFATVKAHLEQIAPAVAQKNINLAILRELPIIQPDHDLITEFFVRETALRTQKDRSDVGCKAMDTLFTSLQHRAFRGEL